MPAPKRPNYFQSQFLVVRDFTEEQDYHREMLQLHNQLMHDWGVVGDGLKVTGSGVNLSIGAGSAIDSFGQAIVLEADTPIKIPAGQDVWITIAFQELNSTDKDDKYPPPGGSEHVTRLVPSPLIAAVTTAPPTDGKVITLAKVSANGTVDYSVRKLASSFMRVGGANDLSIGPGRQVGIGTADPRAPLHIKGNVGLLNLEGDTHGFVQFYPKGFDAGRKGWLGFGSAGDSDLRIENEADGGNVVLSSVKGYVGAVCSAGGAQGIQFGNREIKFRGDGIQHFSIFANKVNKALTFARSGSTENMDTVDANIMTLADTGKVGIGTTSPAEALTVGASTAGGNYAQDGQIGWRDSYKLFRAGAQQAAIGTDASGARLQLFTGSTSDDSTARLTVDSSGNIGIGTQTPVAKLHGKAGEKLVQLSGSFSTVSDTDRQIYFPPGADISGLSAGDWLVMGDERRQVEGVFTAFIRVKGTQFKARSGPLYVVRAGDIFRGDDWKGNLKVLINSDGNVGIGTTTPGFPLTFPNTLGDKIAIWGQSGNSFGLGVDNSLFQIHTDQPGSDIAFGYGSSGSFTETMRVKGNGNVGIGTIIPQRGKVEIVGSQTPNFGVLVSYLQANAAFPVGSTVDPGPVVSLYATNDIAAARCLVFSDERIKHIQGRSDSTADLHTLLGIEVTDFRYKDVIGKGNGLHKKVVAQQVEKVFPQAVSKQTDLVPDIYQQASLTDGWIELATDLKKGERVKLITEKGEGVHEVIEAKPDKFRADFKPEGDKVFVFGREVNDFRNVDYDAIAMLNVSATQQLKKEKDEEVKALRNQIEDLQAASDALISRLQILESKMATASSLVVAKNGSNGNGRP